MGPQIFSPIRKNFLERPITIAQPKKHIFLRNSPKGINHTCFGQPTARCLKRKSQNVFKTTGKPFSQSPCVNINVAPIPLRYKLKIPFERTFLEHPSIEFVNPWKPLFPWKQNPPLTNCLTFQNVFPMRKNLPPIAPFLSPPKSSLEFLKKAYKPTTSYPSSQNNRRKSAI